MTNREFDASMLRGLDRPAALKQRFAGRLRLKLPFLIASALAMALWVSGAPQAQTPLSSLSLKSVPVPGPSQADLAEFVIDKDVAIQLGKALFWEPRVGSDNKTACAACHFSAGGDSRTKNQLSPGLLRLNADLSSFKDITFQVGNDPKPNRQLLAADFPFTRFLMDTNSPYQRNIDANDVASSQGVFNGVFNSINVTNKGAGVDTCNYTYDPDGFHLNGSTTNTRRVEPRNTPTVINAVFNFRNFWDGRGNNVFNGGDPFGMRNPNALVWKLEAGILRKVPVSIPSSSLASQGSGPPLSGTEMSCSDRTFVHLAQKLLNQKILAGQTIAPDDSVLGVLAASPPNYQSLVKKAFNPAYWQSPAVVKFGRIEAQEHKSMDLLRPVPFNSVREQSVSQIEANFGLFFSLALQMYQSTLVADDSRFDQYAAGDASKLTAPEQAGLTIFQGKGSCIACHGGAEMTNASFRNVINQRLETMTFPNGLTKTYDTGFYNIGVRPTLEDIGVGDTDPFGLPLSETLIFATKPSDAARLLGNNFDPSKYTVDPNAVNVLGAFKTPGLRNVELTGPYFHNGGTATLMQVVDFYNRGGDFGQDNQANLHPDIRPLGLSEDEKKNLVSFLLSLTDERVRMRKAPFDHPSLCMPNGHSTTAAAKAVNATDLTLCIGAVGRNGTAVGLTPFMQLNPFSP
jgi:cytochrome c peroxidase